MAISPCGSATDPQGRELVQHGTALFPAACYLDDPVREPVPWHWHTELETGIVTAGSAVIAAGTERFILRQGMGFLSPPAYCTRPCPMDRPTAACTRWSFTPGW